MAPIIVDTKELNLPQSVAAKLKGTKVEVVETKDGVLLRPVGSSISSARGFLKGRELTTKEFAELKEEENLSAL
ncbi:hypothetical protein FJY63_08155 [Candidatus Sumerlaeota bacterium]|nr:hypothetical protein [Candidatus Sumerlaeota bacterium]